MSSALPLTALNSPTVLYNTWIARYREFGKRFLTFAIAFFMDLFDTGIPLRVQKVLSHRIPLLI